MTFAGFLTALMLAAGSVTASATIASADSVGSSSLTLSIFHQTTGVSESVTLTCEPTGGDHPDAAEACDDLIAAGGEISNIPPTNSNCLAVHIPVTARAFGFWQGRFISYSEDFTNEGCARVGTGGHVFNF
jgi:hypothetical protein